MCNEELTSWILIVGFVTLSMGILCLMYTICSIRTNLAFVIVFFTLLLTFSLITGAYWALALDYTGNAAYAGKLLQVRC